jgi:hypothetical protein
MKESVKKEVEEYMTRYGVSYSLEEFRYKTDWLFISQYRDLSEDFIREFKNEVEWAYICKYQELSEDFVREFKDKILWGYEEVYQNLSPEFIYYEVKDLLNDFLIWFCIENSKITKEFIQEKDYEEKIHSRFELLDI